VTSPHTGQGDRQARPVGPSATVRDSGPGPQASTGHWLRQAALSWQRELGRRLRPLKLTPTQFFVLSCTGWLDATSGPPTQQEVADLAGTDRMMTSKVVGTLEGLGLLQHQPDASNGRLKRLSQTPRGREVTGAALVHLRDIEAQFFDGLDAMALRHQLAAVCDRGVAVTDTTGDP
jgi:DNA-binding MarR family transcriptional regulator